MPSSYTIGDHFESFVSKLTESGLYASASEVLRDGLRLLEQREQERCAKLDALRRDIAEGMAGGVFEPLDMATIKQDARSAAGARQN
jgi:antitoxin ParD1/3/4